MKKHISILLIGFLLAGFLFIPAAASSNQENSQMILKGYQTGVARVQNVQLSNQYWYGASNHAAVWTNGAGQAVYCIEPCAATGSGTIYGSTTKDIFNLSPYVCRSVTSADEKERLIGAIMNYSIQGISNPPSDEQALQFLAAQVLIHEVVLEERDAKFHYIGAKAGYSAVKNAYVFTSGDFSRRFLNLYNQIQEEVTVYYTIPSFCSASSEAASTFTLDQYDENTHEYFTNLTDDNQVCGAFFPTGYQFGDLKFIPWNNNRNLRVATSKVDFYEQMAQDGRNQPIKGLLYWGGSSAQQMCQCSGEIADPVSAYFKVKIGNGNAQVHASCEVYDWQSKQSHYENGSNLSLKISCGSHSFTGTTDGNGNFLFSNIPAGSYTLTEMDVPDPYVVPQEQRILVKPAQTSTAEVINTLKRSKAGMINRCTYYGAYLSGAKFQIYTADGVDTGITLTSDAHNWVYSSDLVYGEYFLKELEPPQYYALQENTYPFSIRKNAQTVKVETWNTPLSDVYPEWIPPNSAYRANTEVVASYKIHNDSIAEHAPPRPLMVDQLTVDFTVACDSQVINTQTKKLDVPMFNENLIYFRFTVPNGHSLKLTCEVEIPEGVVETNPDDKVITKEFTIQPVPTSDTPDTKFETLPSNFRLPSEDAPVPTGGIVDAPVQSSQWEIWDYNKGDWTIRTYGIRLSEESALSPDPANPSVISEYGQTQIKSGYGIQFSSSASILSNGISPPGDAYTSVQHGNLYFPEFEYRDQENQYRDLERVAENQFTLKQSPYSSASDGSKDYRRVHFTPLWFPDGNYTVKTFLYDCWTPAGMITLQATPPPVQVQGDMYDDWYISHVS